MASPPPPAGSPSSASMFENVSSQPPPSMPPPPKVDDNDDKDTAAPHVLDEMPDLAHFKILDSEEHMNKYRKYEADFTGRLMAKYFSKHNFYGGNIFDDRITIDGETILSSRWPCTRTFADPSSCIRSFTDPSSSFEGENNAHSTSET